MRFISTILALAVAISIVVSAAQYVLDGFPAPTDALITANAIKVGIVVVLFYVGNTYKSYES